MKLFTLAIALGLLSTSHATPNLIATGSLSDANDLSGLTGTLENGNSAAILGGLGSGLAWAGGSNFVAVPDRGPNATAYSGGAGVDNTTSYISRLQNLNLALTQTSPGVFTLTPTLTSTTLLYSTSALNYGPVSTVDAGKNYFNGRSDNFGAGNSLNSSNARLDPEAVRISNDGLHAYVSDEYGPYVYEFDRSTGERTRVFTLPGNLGIANPNAVGATEISGNTTSGRIANKGMEGLAISPDGTTLYGFMQSPLAQDGGDGGRSNRIIKINIATGVVQEFAYDNRVGTKNYNSSEILAINDHEFIVLERDGKGLGDGTSAAFKSLYKVDLTGATDVTSLSGESTLQALAPAKSLFLDIRAVLNANGVTDANIPAKLEGIAWGEDVNISGTNFHTLYLANDNDFVPGVAGNNKFFVFSVSDADIAGTTGSTFQNQAVPEPSTWMLLGLSVAGWFGVKRWRKTA